jgi:hypothetical protein
MNRATSIHPMTNPFSRAEQPRRVLRTNLRGGVALMLAWILLEGAFLFDVTRRPPGVGARESAATTQVGALAQARSSQAPCSP